MIVNREVVMSEKENHLIGSKLSSENSQLESHAPHCVLPLNFFDLMLKKLGENTSREETTIIEIHIAKNPLPKC